MTPPSRTRTASRLDLSDGSFFFFLFCFFRLGRGIGFFWDCSRNAQFLLCLALLSMHKGEILNAGWGTLLAFL
jgi:hypothetical protein